MKRKALVRIAQAHEAADAGLLSPELAAGISRVKGVKQLGFRSGNWLSAEPSSQVLRRACGDSMRANRDYAMLTMLFARGFRRSELVGLELDDIQMRQGHWAVVDLIGKGGHIRTVPLPNWMTRKGVGPWHLAKRCRVCGPNLLRESGLRANCQHDLRRTCAKLRHDRGGELEQIQFLLGHASVQTTERYLGGKQNLGHPVTNLFDLRADAQQQTKHDKSVPANGASLAVEKAHEPEIECAHGGSEHEHLKKNS